MLSIHCFRYNRPHPLFPTDSDWSPRLFCSSIVTMRVSSWVEFQETFGFFGGAVGAWGVAIEFTVTIQQNKQEWRRKRYRERGPVKMCRLSARKMFANTPSEADLDLAGDIWSKWSLGVPNDRLPNSHHIWGHLAKCDHLWFGAATSLVICNRTGSKTHRYP